ncbi:MAG TPA: tetratricopeptide repeat protein, partial [Candidatus Acidoferrales bacterium]|nr:tetratricopeptide repeat protein [Candidatus Acidoferrales bacterium]
ERIVTAGQADYTARIWDAQNGKQLMGPLQHTTPVNSAQFSPDGKRILTTTWGGTTRVWDAQTGAMLAGPATQGNRVNSAQYSRDAKRIVTATGTVARVWDAENGKALTEPLLHTSVVNSAQFSPDGKRVLTVSRDGTARVWEAENAQRPLAELLPQGGSSFAQFSADGTLILTVSGGSARIWNAQSRQPLTSVNCVSAQFSPDGQRVVTVGPDYAVRVWNAHTGQLLTDPLRHAFMVKSAQFSPDGDRIVTVSAETWVWDARSGRALLPKPLQHRTMANWAQFSPDGDRLVTAWADGTASVWDAQSGRELLELPHGDFNFVNSAQFSPDGKRIVTLTQDGVARLWDASSGQQSAQLGGEVQSAQFSPDGSRILTTSGTTARLWDALSGQPLTEPLQHVSAVKSAQFSPDGKRIVTAAGSVARVWDSQTGQELMEPLSHGRSARPGEFKRGIYGSEVIGVIWFVDSAQFSPDGRRIITAADDGVVRIWDVAPSPATHPAWLPELAGAFSGLRLNDQGLLEPTRLSAAEVINRLRQELNRTSNDDDWVVWGRWLLADPATRTISPFSRQTVPEYIEERLTEGTTESFDEAERAAGENDLLLKRIAQARDNLELSSRALMLKHDADTLVAQGKLPEAEAKYSEVLDIDRKVRGPEHPDTIRAMHDLADSYYSLGRGSEAIVLLASACALDPTDTDASLTLATWQTWFGQDADYEATCRRLIQQAEGTNEAGTGERAGKAACLRPSTDGALLAKALALTQRAVELGQNTSAFRWYQLSLGLAEYRNDHYADAERTLVLAEQAGADNAEFLGIARFYHVMNLFRQNRLEQARKLFAQAEAEMPPFPQDVRQPLEDGKPVSHDRLICWMAYKEAQFLLNAQPKTVQEGR